MLKAKVTIGNDLLNILALTKTAAARMIAVKVVAEFDKLLMEAPQYSGNYVANMRIAVGDRARGEGESRAYIKYPKRPKRAGTMEPIVRARSANNLDTFEERFVSHALTVPWAGMKMSVWNPIREAEFIENMPASRLRDVNKGGANAMSKFYSRISDLYVNINVKVV